MTNTLISIIVPCYNQAQYLDECLQSVLDQSYQNWECIVVNDGSPDNTEEAALKWTKIDPRFTYLKKENGGLSSARNFGIERAQGEWILPLDSDDKIGSQYLELAEKEFNQGYTIIYCNAEFFGGMSKEWKLPEYQYDEILRNNLIFCSAFFKKIDWEKAHGFDENLIYGREDWDFWLSILQPESKVKRLNYLGFYYRRKEDSMDITLNKDEWKKNHAANYIFKKHLIKYISENHNSIDTFYYYKNFKSKYYELINKLYRSRLTRFLFKLINKIS